MKNNPLLILFSLLTALSLLLAGCGNGGATVDATPTPYPTPIRPTFTVQRGDIAVNAKLFGRVTPLALHTVYFQMSGHVSEVYANVNDVVKKGQALGDLAELQDLKTKASETRHEIRRAQIALEIAQLTLEKYKAENRPDYDIKVQELQVELAQMSLDEVLEKLGIDPTTDVLDQLDAEAVKARAIAPTDGTIIAAVNVGRSVTTTTPAFVLGDSSKLEVVADLTTNSGDEQVKEMFEGMPVVVSLDAKPDVQLTGKIRQLPSPYGTGSSEENAIHIVLDQAPSPDTYQTGDKVTITVQLASKSGVLWLPPDAIRKAGGRTFVIVNSESGPKRVDVEIGLQTRDMVEIVSGLTEGQVVVGP
jgi:macrolide-specific efflux system membrane fusion protein